MQAELLSFEIVDKRGKLLFIVKILKSTRYETRTLEGIHKKDKLEDFTFKAEKLEVEVVDFEPLAFERWRGFQICMVCEKS